MIKNLDKVLDNKYGNGIITTLIILYASKFAPELPESTKNIFNNIYFRIIVLFILAFQFTRSSKISIIISIYLTILSLIIVNKEEETCNKD